MARVQANVAVALQAPVKRGPGRPPKVSYLGVSTSAAKVLTRKRPRQLCPVPNCKNAAAPIFGMVCAEHKDVAKTKIKKYRDARRAAKTGASA